MFCFVFLQWPKDCVPLNLSTYLSSHTYRCHSTCWIITPIMSDVSVCLNMSIRDRTIPLWFAHSLCFSWVFLRGGQSAVFHTAAPLEVIISQCSVKQMMQTWGSKTVLHVRPYCISISDNARDADLKRLCNRESSCAVWLPQCITHLHSHCHTVLFNMSPQVWSSQIKTISCAIHHILPAGLKNGLCQRQCQSIGCSFWVCLGVVKELCILQRSAQWLAKSWLYWFLSSLLFVKISKCGP